MLIKSRTNKTDKPGKEAGGVAEMGMQEAQGSTLSPTVLGVLCNGSDSRPKEDHGRCAPLMETKASDAHQWREGVSVATLALVLTHHAGLSSLVARTNPK